MRVFISYARKDAADLAQELNRYLGAEGLEPWLDTSRLKGGAVWTKDIESAINSCDAFLALLSPGSYRSDICRAEQLRALRRGKLVIPVLAQPGTDIPLHLETRNYRDLTGGKPKAGQLKLLLQDIRARKKALSCGRNSSSHTSPPRRSRATTSRAPMRSKRSATPSSPRSKARASP